MRVDWKYVLSIFGASAVWICSVYTWYRSQAAERKQREYNRKEGLYRELLRTLIVFYKGGPETGAGPFLEQYRLAWLYAPDNVIRILSRLAEVLKVNSSERYMSPDQLLQIAQSRDVGGGQILSELVAAIRKDLLESAGKRTKLAAVDFGHYI
jgi:hypothetical protein